MIMSSYRICIHNIFHFIHTWALFSKNPKGLYLCSEHSEMGSDNKNTLPLKFKLPRVDTLLALSSKITPCKKNNFIYRYRQIMDLLTTSVEVSTLVALSMHYDPSLRCFTFKDFQFVSTIEEYERLLGWYVKDHPPFVKLGELLMPESVVEVLHLSIEEVALGIGPRGFLKNSWKKGMSLGERREMVALQCYSSPSDLWSRPVSK